MQTRASTLLLYGPANLEDSGPIERRAAATPADHDFAALDALDDVVVIDDVERDDGAAEVLDARDVLDVDDPPAPVVPQTPPARLATVLPLPVPRRTTVVAPAPARATQPLPAVPRRAAAAPSLPAVARATLPPASQPAHQWAATPLPAPPALPAYALRPEWTASGAPSLPPPAYAPPSWAPPPYAPRAARDELLTGLVVVMLVVLTGVVAGLLIWAVAFREPRPTTCPRAAAATVLGAPVRAVS